MSSRCVAAVFDRYPVGGGEFALALALADNAHDDGTHIFPHVETMATKSRQSVRAVQGHLRAMLASGWLIRTSSGRGGRGVAAEYRISPAWLKGADIAPFPHVDKPVDNPEKGADSAPFKPKKGCKTEHKRVQNDAQKGADSCTPYITGRTSIEPNTPPTPPPGGADAGMAVAIALCAHFPEHRRTRLAEVAGEVAGLVASGDVTGEQLTQAAEQQAGQLGKDAGKACPSVLNWLRRKCWLDSAALPAGGGVPSDWRESRSGIEAMGARLGMRPYETEPGLRLLSDYLAEVERRLTAQGQEVAA